MMSAQALEEEADEPESRRRIEHSFGMTISFHDRFRGRRERVGPSDGVSGQRSENHSGDGGSNDPSPADGIYLLAAIAVLSEPNAG